MKIDTLDSALKNKLRQTPNSFHSSGSSLPFTLKSSNGVINKYKIRGARSSSCTSRLQSKDEKFTIRNPQSDQTIHTMRNDVLQRRSHFAKLPNSDQEQNLNLTRLV